MNVIEANPSTSACPPEYPSLSGETREVVDTAHAAFHLNRSPQTLRTWACYEHGPIRPRRIHGRLAWPVADLRRIVAVPA